MHFAMLIYESPDAFATRKNDENDPYRDAWREYYRALVKAGVYVSGDAPSTRNRDHRARQGS